MTWKRYSRLMRPFYTEIEPIQPRREDRAFLRYAPKPPMPDVKDEGDFHLDDYPIIKAAVPYEIPDINLKALQYWLDHLGPAIYNPLTAYLDDKGEFHVDLDGSHRLRCLWEIGEPMVRILTRTIPERTPEFYKWGNMANRKFMPAAVEHFKTNPSLTWRQYYPCIHPPTETLLKFYQEKKDGAYYRDTLDTPMTFKEILSQNKNLSYRMDILNEILKFDVKDKSLLDLGCYYGHYSFLLLEAGASEAVGVDTNANRVKIANHIAGRRGINRSLKSFRAQRQDINEHVEKSNLHHDIVLLLNVFHHLLAQNEKRAWSTLDTLLERCELLFLMTQNIKGVFDEWNGDIEMALMAKTGATLEPLLKTRYRNRVLYVARS